jgi:hypothetical protein
LKIIQLRFVIRRPQALLQRMVVAEHFQVSIRKARQNAVFVTSEAFQNEPVAQSGPRPGAV